MVPHLIYVPERVFSTEEFLSSVENAYSKYDRAVIAVSEGIQDAQGTPVAATLVEEIEKDAHGNVQLSGSTSLGDALMNLVKTKLKIKRVRSDTFGYLQRSFLGCVSEVDANEAREVGERAVQIAAWHRVDGSITIERVGDYSVRYDLTPLQDVAKETKAMPDSFIDGVNNVTTEFKNYARPINGRTACVRTYSRTEGGAPSRCRRIVKRTAHHKTPIFPAPKIPVSLFSFIGGCIAKRYNDQRTWKSTVQIPIKGYGYDR